MASSKCMLVAATPEGAASSRAPFVIPELVPSPSTLVEVESGRPVATGLVVFTGNAVHVPDILAKAAPFTIPADDATAVLLHFIEELARLKVGNVVRLEPCTEGFRLVKVMERPARPPSPLP